MFVKNCSIVKYQGAKGLGTRHVVYWNHPYESGAQPLKVNLIIYENDVLQVVSKDVLKNDENKLKLSSAKLSKVKLGLS